MDPSSKLVDSLLWLCRVPSPIGEEAELCTQLEKRLARAPLAQPIRRYENSLVVPARRKTGGPHVGLFGHLDVVRTEHDAPPRIEGDRLYGPGAADMKSGLSVMLALAESERLPNVDLTLVFYAREEGPYAENELGVVLQREHELSRLDVAVALEPSDNKLQLGCSGSLHAKLTFSGRTAHSARPWQGENAIYKALPCLTRVKDLDPVSITVDDLTWIETMSVTLAGGGRARNVIPDHFELNLNYRFGPSTTLEAARARVLELVAEEAAVEFVDLSPSAPPHRHHPLVQELTESGVLAVEPKQAWTDVARLSALGVPAVNFGPGVQAQAHQRNEWTLLPALEESRQIFLRWLERIAT